MLAIMWPFPPMNGDLLILAWSNDLFLRWQNGWVNLPCDYEALSHEERIRRVGAILGKAVTLRLERERAAREGAGEAFPESDVAQPSGHELHSFNTPVEEFTNHELMLLRKAAVLGYIFPRDAVSLFGNSRTTIYRRLQHLEQGGWIIREGQGKASRYRLTDKARASLKRMK